MGSSKKHKDKDRDRDRKREKDKKHERGRERERDRNKDKERSKRSDEERDREKRTKRDHGNEYEKRTDRKRLRRNEDDDELLQYAMEENTTNEKEDYPAKSSSSQGGGVTSLSIEETNKLRVKMGLKPLQVEGSSSQANGNKPVSSTSKEDVHIPAINLSAKEQEEKMRKKLEEIKEKRRLHKKLSKVKALGESSDDEEGAASWVAKSRKNQKEKEMAERRAQMLAEMDEEFGIGDLMADEFAATKREKVYTSRDLRGLNVEHSQQAIKEGQSVILTIKDTSVLEDIDDTLVNVNMLDKERADKNIELKKMRPDYKPYDDEEFDEFGKPKGRTLLSKYDEEIDGEKKKFFKLDMGGRYDASKENELVRIRSSLQNQAVSLQMDRPQLAAEYYTQEEMVKFKKPKKRRKVKKRETLKADELQSVTDSYGGSDHGSRSLKSILKNKSKDDGSRSKEFDDDMDIDFMDPDDDAEILGRDSEEKNIELEEDEAQLELQIALQRSRRLKQKSKTTGAEKVAETVALSAKVKSEQQEEGSIVLDATSEFCRTLGEIPTYGSAADQEEDEEWRMDIEHEDESEVPQGGWEWVKAQEEKKRKEEEDLDSNILDAEPIVGHGIGAALLLAQKKGLLESAKKKEQKFAGMSELPSVGVIDQDKMREEEKQRGSRYNPSQFREKEGYKPDIKLEYVDEAGRALTPKEAFRFLSHKFHGKISGKMKTEKRAKKSNEDLMLKKMSAVDTPLNTVQLLKEKQMSERSPFLILSGGGKTLASGTTTISKGKR